ncbi:unnamed protein product [Heterobilharzia americana]|nr:unnamed protein product [Heterobilharzia americana]
MNKMEQPRFLTGWTPVVKTFVNSNRAVKALWAIFAICMVIALVSSVSVVVHKYLTYVTVVRLDQRGPKDGVPPPAVTICLTEHQTKYLQFQYYKISTKLNIIQGAHKSCRLKPGVIWDSSQDAISEFYNYTKHFTVTFRTEPPGCYSLNLVQDAPLNTTFWKIFHIDVRLADVNQTFLGRPLIIAHETNSFPFDNFGRYLYEYINPGSLLNVFYSKSITKRLHTRRNPCTSKSINLLGNTFDYDQITCQWHTVCSRYNPKCNCTCPLDLLRLRLYRKVYGTKWNQLALLNLDSYNIHTNQSRPFVNNSVCPLACRTVTYKKLNEVLDNITDRSIVQLELIQAEGLTEMTEEALYSLPKLFSEIGGLSSFCFGFSCILFFELFELAFWLRCTYRSQFIERVNEILGQQIEITDEPNLIMKNNDNSVNVTFSKKNSLRIHDKNNEGVDDSDENSSNKQRQHKQLPFNTINLSSKVILNDPLKVRSYKCPMTCTPSG